MGQPYVGEIRMFAGNFAPVGWMFCTGDLLPISEYATLFNLIGTSYGGDGQSTFGLPDLRGRLPLHQGNGLILAQTGGAEQITLTVNQIPGHSHPFVASSAAGTGSNPSDNLMATAVGNLYFPSPTSNPGVMNAAMVSGTGGSQPHTNFQPYLCVSFIISLFGLFPSA